MGALKLLYYSSCTLNGLLQQLAPSICFVTMMAHVNKLCYNHWHHESSLCFIKWLAPSTDFVLLGVMTVANTFLGSFVLSLIQGRTMLALFF